MKRRSIALPDQLDAYVGTVAEEWGVQASEVIRNAVLEWKDRREKFVPRQAKPRRVNGQAKIPLEDARHTGAGSIRSQPMESDA